MARFSTLPNAAPARSPYGIGMTPTPTATHQYGGGFAPSDPHAELFNAAVSGMLSDQFYESGDDRAARVAALVPQCNPEWLLPFTAWLRNTAHLRSASIVIAAEYAKAGMPDARQVVASALQRPDEPAEMLGYWMSRHGRNVPSRVKRGIADATVRLYDEMALLRWDGQSKTWRFGDVIEFVHPTPSTPWQSALFKYALDRRRHPDEMPPVELGRVHRTVALERLDPAERRAHLADAVEAGFSWERIAGWLPDGMDGAAWTAVAPSMGYMALLRNLNNFDRHGVNAASVLERLTDVDQIKRSRVMPFRFLTAYLNLEADTYKMALSTAADVALENLPTFGGRTLIMVDCSGSMNSAVGAGKSRSPLRLSQAAAFMAEALARRCETANIVTYDEAPISHHEPARHVGVLRAAASDVYHPRGGTSTWSSTREALNTLGTHDRVVIITDEQTSDHDDGTVTIPVVTWNMAGYRPHQAAHGTARRFLVAGYSDTALQVLPSVMGVGDGRWPWVD